MFPMHHLYRYAKREYVIIDKAGSFKKILDAQEIERRALS